MQPTKTKTFRRLMAALVLMISVTGYLLADRYLIQHVEIDLSTVSTATLEPQISPNPGATSALEASVGSEDFSADDWNYQSETVSIAIREVSTGSGADRVTYFVADVVVADATLLNSAFANNQYGRNIIQYTSQIAAENNAIFAINGDYYGFRSDGIVIRNGVIYRDEPARTGLAFLKDGSMMVYDETQTSAQALLDQGVWNTLSFGPALVENSAALTGFENVSVDTNIGNHPIQGNQPRTGVGMIDKNHFVFVVVDGRSRGYSRGVSLDEFAQIFAGLGCTDAYNIDGGGSSTMYFLGRVVNNPLGSNKERGTSDILMVSNG